MCFSSREVKDYLPHCPFGVAQRSLIVARLFGDESEITFWTIALHYLRNIKAEVHGKVGFILLSWHGAPWSQGKLMFVCL